ARVLERLVPLGRVPEQRADERLEGRSGRRPAGALHPGLAGLLRALLPGPEGVAGRLALGAALASPRVLPGAVVVLADEAVVRPLGGAAPVLHEAREDAVQVLGVLEPVADDGGGVGVVEQP